MLSLSQVLNDAAPTVVEGGGTLIGGYIYLSESQERIIQVGDMEFLKSGNLIVDGADQYPEAFNRFSVPFLSNTGVAPFNFSGYDGEMVQSPTGVLVYGDKYSLDSGRTWNTGVNPPLFRSLICWDGDRFVAIWPGAGQSKWSTDGINWTTGTGQLPNTVTPASLTYWNGRYYLSAKISGSSAHRSNHPVVFSTDDPINGSWVTSLTTTFYANNNPWNGTPRLLVHNDILVYHGYAPNYGTTPSLYTTSNDTNWTVRFTATSEHTYWTSDIASGGGVLSTSYGKTSYDGMTFTDSVNAPGVTPPTSMTLSKYHAPTKSFIHCAGNTIFVSKGHRVVGGYVDSPLTAAITAIGDHVLLTTSRIYDVLPAIGVATPILDSGGGLLYMRIK